MRVERCDLLDRDLSSLRGGLKAHHQARDHPRAIIMEHQRFIMCKAATLAVILPLSLGLFACASQEEGMRAQLAEKQAAGEAEDEATCRAKVQPGTEAYDACRQALAAERAERAAVQEQKRRDFDRVLGAGTDGLSDY
jgi:hypothetical protein